MITRLKFKSQSLTFRIAMLLALALLPIGMISVHQTSLLIAETEDKKEAALLALGAEAADLELGYMQKALGVAQALAVAAPALRREGPDCNAQLREFLNVAVPMSLIAYVSSEGQVTCASSGAGQDVSGTATYKLMKDSRVPHFVPVQSAVISKADVVVVAVPVMVDDAPDGYVVISLLHDKLSPVLERREDVDWPVSMLTFNREGAVLTSENGLANVAATLPANADLANLARIGKTVFLGTTREGEDRIFAAVPLIRGQVYALAGWDDPRNSLLHDGMNLTNSIFFPLAMWAAGLVVAFYAVQTMVIRPTRNLRARMLVFMRSRQILPLSDGVMVPLELREMDQTWQRLAESVLRDEAALHNTIHDKTVLVKEVHHRVKNNLQLIVSILNMKIRKMKSEQEKRALIDIQQRVMGIARVHQRLYDTSNPERVHADRLLRSIVDEIVASVRPDRGGLTVTQTYDEVVLYPDQAVPMALAVSELALNALKYVGAAEGEEPWLKVSLHQSGEKEARFEIANSVGENSGEKVDGDGLGSKLIRAFVQQIEGAAQEERSQTSFCASITFPIADFVDAD